MKSALILLLILVIISTSALAETPFTGCLDFMERFTMASVYLATEHSVAEPELTRMESSAIADFQVADKITVLLSFDPDVDTFPISEVVFMSKPDASTEEVILAMRETLYGCNVVESIDESLHLVEKLGILRDDAFSDGFSFYETIGNVFYSGSFSENIGIMFIIGKH